MKFGWLKEEEKLIACKVVVKGQARELLLHHLTASDSDEADRKFPRPKPPLLLDTNGNQIKGEDGLVRLNESDHDFLTAAIERAYNHAAFLAVAALGAEAFDARDIDAQIKELCGTFSRAAIIAIRDAAILDSELTPNMLEEAKAALRPTESGS